jgi:peptidyl-prolyl cis-trans isomerase B (cyclophilin B)
MASTAAQVGGSSEFFICDGAQTFLDGNYAAFGVVIEGMDVVRTIAASPNDGSLEPNPGGGKPLTDIVINNIIIISS